ncbi:MAG: dienelactone hydrolase family protein [Cyclobacteriaceae bacterium]
MKNKFILAGFCFVLLTEAVSAFQARPARQAEPLPYANLPDVMPGTKPLSPEEDRSIKILEGAHVFIEERIKAAPAGRARFWNRDLSSKEAYERSVEPNRRRFMKIIGVEDKSKPAQSFKLVLKEEHPSVVMEKIAVNNDPLVISETAAYRVYQVRWPVLHNVYGEGLLLEPKTKSVGNVIAIPDADQVPEQLAGLAAGIPADSQFARRLAEHGYQVLIPVVISRDLLMPGSSELLRQTHREWVYRQAFHMGRHIIGYEVQKILSAVDWFKQGNPNVKVGVAGYHEGGLLAFYSAAVDKRIDAALVSGYFNSRQKVWDEPIYRNVWNLLSEFGDAEVASLIAPRALIVEHSSVPEWIDQAMKPGGDPVMVGQWAQPGYKGSLRTPEWKTVQEEYQRIGQLTRPGFQAGELIKDQNNWAVQFGTQKAIESLSKLLGGKAQLPLGRETSKDNRKNFDAKQRQVRQLKELENHVQWLMRDSDYERNEFFLYNIMPEFEKRTWSTKPHHPAHSPQRFIEQSREYRKMFHDEVIGRFEDPMLPADPHTRKLYDNDKWTGYEVQMDVYPNLQAAGVVLIPKDLKPGEKRPVVVCQHGRDGFPQKLVEEGYTAYNQTATKLADRGFIVYAPYNPYRGEDKYRWMVRKATSVGKSMFSFVISQHDQTLRWLGSLPFVDPERIAFYGLSFGGETAMRVPSVLESYCLSICSGDFGDYTRKVVDTHFSRGFMNSMEWEIPVFNLGSTFSHAEMAYLIFPRPFMVERGHDDLVQQTDWVSYEFGKVRYLYDQFGLGDKTAIEYFNGGHSMRGEGTFDFLHKHLKWPQQSQIKQ